MATLDHELVNRYIKSGEVFATSETERKMVCLASALNTRPRHRAKRVIVKYQKAKSARGTGDYSAKRSGKFIAQIHASAETPFKEDETTRTWRHLIEKEIHLALCTRSVRYRKYVDALDHNANLLIGTIAGFAATKLGMAVPVVAGLVAALLRMAVKLGVAVFCKKFADAG